MVVRTLKDLQGRIDDLSENLSKERVSIKKDIGTIKKNHSEMKNILEGIKSKLYEAEGWISELEDKIRISTQREI